MSKNDWPPAVLRELWSPLQPGITRRGRSVAHEVAWLSLAGFLLRPGYGWEGDRERMIELWRLKELGLSHRKEASAHVQWWILWRRVCGGLSSEQQEWLFEQAERALERQLPGRKEAYRLLGSLERIPNEKRVAIGKRLIKRFAVGKVDEAEAWAFGRLASRVPLYGKSAAVIPPEQLERWFARVADLDWSSERFKTLAKAFHTAARCAEQEHLNLSQSAREQIAQKLSEAGFADEELAVLFSYVPLLPADAGHLFGESLPLGLRLDDTDS